MQDNTPISINENPPSPSGLSAEIIMAIVSIIFGLTGSCLMLFAGFCGAPFPIIGLILGFLALRDPNQKVLAIIGIVISGASLLLLCALFFVFGGMVILGPTIENVFSSINQSLAP